MKLSDISYKFVNGICMEIKQKIINNASKKDIQSLESLLDCVMVAEKILFIDPALYSKKELSYLVNHSSRGSELKQDFYTNIFNYPENKLIPDTHLFTKFIDFIYETPIHNFMKKITNGYYKVLKWCYIKILHRKFKQKYVNKKLLKKLLLIEKNKIKILYEKLDSGKQDLYYNLYIFSECYIDVIDLILLAINKNINMPNISYFMQILIGISSCIQELMNITGEIGYLSASIIRDNIIADLYSSEQ